MDYDYSLLRTGELKMDYDYSLLRSRWAKNGLWLKLTPAHVS